MMDRGNKETNRKYTRIRTRTKTRIGRKEKEKRTKTKTEKLEDQLTRDTAFQKQSRILTAFAHRRRSRLE